MLWIQAVRSAFLLDVTYRCDDGLHDRSHEERCILSIEDAAVVVRRHPRPVGCGVLKGESKDGSTNV